ncbi:16S rRNA (guanine966-N2)-methyltransferase [Alicyclobacillus sacchari]|uniref:16S rRNA (Guanine966-N2)-methyltransferase n=2 Tax=Alicyclobacillus sacchari TaxID=392010 RepID=A0A4R8LPR6_9BACL|nr:16S rRNA (guanine966-N2)-methyltransferase [Alicyclobacillus sacchari]GMA58862.1 rRNA methyltransferase [Alicyclobacillus sacchari]
MRVIAGKWRSMPLVAPKGAATRPTTDRVKESMFNLIPHSLSGVVVDLFAGSGALGIEALSRGAERAIFVDRDGKALRTVRDNLVRVHGLAQAELWQTHWRHAIARLSTADDALAYVFVDPPYAERLWQPVLEALPANRVVGGVVCELPKEMELPDLINHFAKVKYRVYGDIAIALYQPVVG